MSETKYIIHNDGNQKEFTDEQAFRDTVQLLEETDTNFKTETVSNGSDATENTSDVEVVDDTEKMKEGYTERSGDDTNDSIPTPSQLTSDPLDIISKNADQFTDTIKGTVTINRQGYAVLAEHFNISVESVPITLPSETDFEYAEFKAIATTESGEMYTGFGSAHVNRETGDDKHLLGELAETRAMKRATAWATGVGMTAVSELTGDLPE